MKFNSMASLSENYEAWKNYRFKHSSTQYPDLSQDERERLKELNERLKKLEVTLAHILKSKHDELSARKENPSDWLEDFNLELVVKFHLREGDSDFEEDDENILWECEEMYFGNPKLDFGDPKKHHGWDLHDPPWFPGEIHGYFYHKLYDYTPLAWHDLLRIGKIRFALRVEEQSNLMC